MLKAQIFGDWRLQVFWVAIALACGLGGVTIGWLLRDIYPSIDIGIAANMLAGVGSLAAASAAVIVPMRQNDERRREQREQQLMADRLVSEEVYRASFRLTEIAESVRDKFDVPPIIELSHLQTQLIAAKQTTTDRAGRIIIEDLAYHAARLLDEADKRNSGRRIRTFSQTVPQLEGDVQRAVQALPALRDQAFDWMERVVTLLEQQGKIRSTIVRGEGKSTVTMHATGEGRLESNG